MYNKKRPIKFFLSLIAAGLVFTGVFVSKSNIPVFSFTMSNVIGDGFIIAALVVQLLASKNSVALNSIPLDKRLYKFVVTNFFLIILLASGVAIIPAGTDLVESLSERVIIDNIVFVSIICYLAVLISTSIFLLLYGFILIKRTKRTKNYFWALYVGLLLYVFICGLVGKNILGESNQLTENPLNIVGLIVGIITIFLMVINSYRNSWVNYLNKNQKIACLFTGVLITVLIIMAEYSNSANLLYYIKDYSLATGIFFDLTKDFLLIYLILSIFSLLLHLPTAGIFDKKVRQLSSLHQIGSVMTKMHNFDKLLDLITKQTLEVVEADSAWLMMKNKNSGSFKLAASSQVPANLMNMIKSKDYSELLNRISEMESPLILNDLQRVKNVPAIKQSKKIGGSLTGVPLMSTSRGIVGIIFAYKEMEYGFDHEDSDMIQAYANQTMIAIENSILFDESLERERLQQELNVAREIQLKLLPKEIPYMADNIKIEAVSIPAYEVGGDYYDFIKLTDNQWGIYVGDVSGKSVSAALYMAELKGFVQSLARLYHSPKELMIKVNETLYPNIDRRSFISLIAAVIDLKENKIKFTRAGHTPLGYYDPEEEEWKMLRPEGLGLGLDKGSIFNRVTDEWEINFAPGCILFFYTDGVTEVFNSENEEFGDERLLSTLEYCQKNDVSSYKDVILDELKSFSQENKPDDITMVIIKHEKNEKGN